MKALQGKYYAGLIPSVPDRHGFGMLILVLESVMVLWRGVSPCPCLCPYGYSPSSWGVSPCLMGSVLVNILGMDACQR